MAPVNPPGPLVALILHPTRGGLFEHAASVVTVSSPGEQEPSPGSQTRLRVYSTVQYQLDAPGRLLHAAFTVPEFRTTWYLSSLLFDVEAMAAEMAMPTTSMHVSCLVILYPLFVCWVVCLPWERENRLRSSGFPASRKSK